MVLNVSHRHLAVLYCLSQRRPKVTGHGLFLVQAGRRSLLGAVCTAPIGNDETLISPILFEGIVQGVGVLTSVVAVDAVIGAHHRAWARDLDADVEGEKIALLHGTFRDDRVHDVSTGLLVVDGEMLDVANDVLRLFALHQIANHCSGQQRIFSGVLEGPPVPRFARQIDAPAQTHIEALRSQLSTDERAVLAGTLRVPARSGRQIRRERGRIAAIRPAVRAAVREMGQGHLPLGSMCHAVAVQERNLLVQGHLLQHQPGPLFRREGRVHPGLVRVLPHDRTCGRGQSYGCCQYTDCP